MQRAVAVIGAGGRMGSWFVKYFVARNCSVSMYDANRSALNFKLPSITVADSIASCVALADLVLVCVPVRLTPKIMKECAMHMKSGASLAEISSVKHNTFPALAKTRKDLQKLCLHPMFGPGAKDKVELKILLVPVRNQQDELQKAQEFFRGTRLLIVPSAHDHDNAIGIVLGLTYFCNLGLADFISSKGDSLLTEVSGTTFRLQSILAESIMTDDVELISVLIRDNPYARKHVRQFLKKALALAALASKKNPGKFEAEIKRVKGRMERKGDLQRSYDRLYALMQSLDA